MPICRYYEVLQFLHDTVFNDETDGNVDIEFSQRASANVKMKVFEGEGNANVPVTHEVTPPEKKWGNTEKALGCNSEQTREKISTTNLVIKKTVNDFMILMHIFAEV